MRLQYYHCTNKQSINQYSHNYLHEGIIGNNKCCTFQTMTVLFYRDLRSNNKDHGGLVFRLDKCDTFNSMGTNLGNISKLLANNAHRSVEEIFPELTARHILRLLHVRLSISRCCCFDGSSIHEPIFCCSSHSPDTCPHPVLHILLPTYLWPSTFILVFISPMFDVFLCVRNNLIFAF